MLDESTKQWWGPYVAFLAILVILGLAVFAGFSQGPLPSPLVGAQNEQSQTAPTNQSSSSNERGSEEAPIFVKVLPSEEAKQEAREAATDRQQQATNERWLTIWTGVLAIFTVLLVVVAGIQAGFFWVQLKLMRKGVDDAAVAADAAKQSAVAAQRSADYLRNVDRAYLIPINPELRNFERYALGPDDQTLKVHFQIKNLGPRPAILKSYAIAHEICWHNQQGSVTPIVRDQFGILPISADAVREFEAPFDVFRIAIPDLEAMFAVQKSLYVYGNIRYSDFFGIIRRTGFIFEFVVNQDDHGQSTFVVCPHRLWYDEEEKTEDQ